MVQSYNGRIAKLMFLSVKADNAGVYECTGTNNNGEVKSVATLIVQGGQYFIYMDDPPPPINSMPYPIVQ